MIKKAKKVLVLGFATLSIFQCVDCFVYFSPLYVLYHGVLLVIRNLTQQDVFGEFAMKLLN